MKKKLLIIAAAILGFMALVVAVLFFVTSGDRKLAEQFVNDIAGGKPSSAYSQFSDALRQQQDETTFTAAIEGLRLDGSCKLSIESLASETGVGNTLNGKVKCSDKEYTATFVYLDGKLQGYSIKP